MDSTTRSRWRDVGWVVGCVTCVLLLCAGVAWAAVAYLTTHLPGDREADRGTATAPVVLTDRAAGATIEALRRLDACRLVDPAALSPGDPEPPSTGRDGPHMCEVGGSGGLVEVTVGAGFAERARWYAEPIVVGGVKAYRNRPAEADRWNGYCEINVPVTFSFAVQFRLRYADEPDMCRTAERVAAAAVPLLRDPPPSPPPDQVPLAGIDPCAVLAAAGPSDFASTRLEDVYGGIDTCQMTKDGRSVVTLQLVYGEPSDGDGCNRVVVVPGTRVGTRSVALLRINDLYDDCARAAAVADRSLAALAAAPAPTAPTRPVRLFAPDEPDIAKTGACVDQVFECLLPGDVDVPDDVDGLLDEATTDTSYTCRAAEESVHRVFGPSLRPTIYGDYCHFLDDRHEIDVGVAMGSSFDLRQYGNRDSYEASEDTVVEGHESRYRESVQVIDRLYSWIVRPRPGPPGPADDGPGRGTLQVSVTHTMPRGVQLGPEDMPRDQAVHDRTRALVADLLRTRFR